MEKEDGQGSQSLAGGGQLGRMQENSSGTGMAWQGSAWSLALPGNMGTGGMDMALLMVSPNMGLLLHREVLLPSEAPICLYKHMPLK